MKEKQMTEVQRVVSNIKTLGNEKFLKADILDVIHENEKKAYEILMRLPDWMVAAIIDEEEDQDKYNILRLFNKDRQKKILNEMSSDEITDLVGILSEDESKDILSMMNEEEREDVKSLLKYDSETAGDASLYVHIRHHGIYAF